MVVLTQMEFVFALVTLPDLALLIIHGALSLLHILLRILLSILSLLFLSDVMIHFSSDLLRIWFLVIFRLSICLPFLLLFFILQLLLFLLDFSHFCKMKQVFFESRQILYGLDPLRRRDQIAIVRFQRLDSSNNVVFTALPLLTGITSQIQLFEVWQLTEACYTVLQILNIDKVDSKV